MARRTQRGAGYWGSRAFRVLRSQDDDENTLRFAGAVLAAPHPKQREAFRLPGEQVRSRRCEQQKEASGIQDPSFRLALFSQPPEAFGGRLLALTALLQPHASESLQKILALPLSERQILRDPGERDVGLHAAQLLQ